MPPLKKTPARSARYPLEFRQILMRLPTDGTAFDVEYPSESDAIRERLQFYNFLRFLKRNPIESEQFGDRALRCVLAIRHNTLSFSLRKHSASSALAQALAKGNEQLEPEAPITLDPGVMLFGAESFNLDALRESVEADMPERNAGISKYFGTEAAATQAATQAAALPDNIKELPTKSARAEAFKRQAEEIRQNNVENGLDSEHNLGKVK